MRRTDFLRGGVEISREIVARNDKLAGIVQRLERRFGFDCQLIEREMLAGELECFAKLSIRPSHSTPLICSGRA